MSRSSQSEDEPEQRYPYAKFHNVTPVSRSEHTTKPITPPIPLALPQLLDAEKREQLKLVDRLVELSPSEEIEPMTATKIMHFPATTEWPGHLRIVDVGQGHPTVRESSSFAEAAQADEHQIKQRPSIVKSTIRDLLSATKRRVSGKSARKDGSMKENAIGEQAYKPKFHEADSTQVDTQESTEQPVPKAETHIGSLDGKLSSFNANDLPTKILDSLGEDATQALTRKSSLKPRLIAPSETRSISPKKQAPLTPIRGRNRLDHSPGGRPLALDQRFNLSPSRSNSRGSRGSLTFNIKARVSPGRGNGKDDTELFVTANIESDHSDEEN